MTKPRALQVLPGVRKCKWPGCKATLNTHNKTDQCLHHRIKEVIKRVTPNAVLEAAYAYFGTTHHLLFNGAPDPEVARKRKVVVHILHAHCHMRDAEIAAQLGIEQSAVTTYVSSAMRNTHNIKSDTQRLLQLCN